MASSLSLRHQVASVALRHQAASSMLRHQSSRSAPRHQAASLRLRHQSSRTAHVRNPEDLTRWICPSNRSSRLNLSIPSDILGLFEKSVGLVCPSIQHCGRRKASHFQCQTKLILVQTEWSQMGYMSTPGQLKGLEFGKDTWRKAIHSYQESLVSNNNLPNITHKDKTKNLYFITLLFIYLIVIIICPLFLQVSRP